MTKHQDGFTIIELLVTLFVAGILLMAGFQLFTVALKSSAASSQQATISDVAYNYLQQYGAMAQANCPALGAYPLGTNGTTVSVAGVQKVNVTVTVDCGSLSTNDLSRVNVTLTYGTPAQTLTMNKSVNSNSSTITKNLIGWWPLNATTIGDSCSISNVVITPDGSNDTSGSGACVYDVSGNHYDGIERGGISQTTGANGSSDTALNFDGTSGFIALPAMSNSSITSAGLTFSVWANVTTIQNYARFIELGNSTSGTGTNAQNDTIDFASTSTTPRLYAALYNGTTTSSGPSNSTGEITTGSWHNYAATITQAGAIIFYKDGVKTGTATSSAGYSSSVTRHSNFIGGSTWTPGGTTLPYSGSMEDFRMYNRVLSATEINDIYQAGAL